MRNNIRLELERGANLDNLQIRAGNAINDKKLIFFSFVDIEDMNNSTQQFAHTSKEVKNKYWWKNCRVQIKDIINPLKKRIHLSS